MVALEHILNKAVSPNPLFTLIGVHLHNNSGTLFMFYLAVYLTGILQLASDALLLEFIVTANFQLSSLGGLLDDYTI